MIHPTGAGVNMARLLDFEVVVEVEAGLLIGHAGVPGLTGTAAVIERWERLTQRKRGLAVAERTPLQPAPRLQARRPTRGAAHRPREAPARRSPQHRRQGRPPRPEQTILRCAGEIARTPACPPGTRSVLNRPSPAGV